MNAKQWKSFKPGTPLFYAGRSILASDGEFDVTPGRCHIMKPEPGWSVPEQGEVWANLGGWYICLPVERLHPTWELAMEDVLRMLGKHQRELRSAFTKAYELLSQGEPPPDDSEDR